MQFKSPNDEPIYIAELSGHCAVVGSEWRELPVQLHKSALMLGCITDNMSKEAVAEIVKFNAPPVQDNHSILVSIIKGMADNPAVGDFTAAELPNLKVLSAKAGWTVNKEEMMQAVHAVGSEEETLV